MSAGPAFDATSYFAHRPRYTPSFFNAHFAYHSLDARAQWDTAVDLGCGPGTSSWGLSKRFKRVVGLDPSEDMVRVAQSVRPQEDLGLDPLPEGHCVEFKQGSDAKIPLPDASVDLVRWLHLHAGAALLISHRLIRR